MDHIAEHPNKQTALIHQNRKTKWRRERDSILAGSNSPYAFSHNAHFRCFFSAACWMGSRVYPFRLVQICFIPNVQNKMIGPVLSSSIVSHY